MARIRTIKPSFWGSPTIAPAATRPARSGLTMARESVSGKRWGLP